MLENLTPYYDYRIIFDITLMSHDNEGPWNLRQLEYLYNSILELTLKK